MKIDLGKSSEAVPAINTSSNNKYYPQLYLDNKNNDCKVGETVYALVQLKLVSESQNVSSEGKRVSCSYDVLNIDFDYDKEDSDEEDKD